MAQEQPASAPCLERVVLFWRMPRPQNDSSARQAQLEDELTRTTVHDVLTERGIQFAYAQRGELREMAKGADLVIAIGGDGTFLEASHELLNTPLLGVNSAQSFSLGHYCIANWQNLPQIMDAIKTGQKRPLSVLRLTLTLDGEELSRPVLNEVLICDECPAAMSSYMVSVNGHEELHHSSGILIGTAGGSTGTMRSAGGVVLPLTAQKWQYLTRELFLRPGEKQSLVRGILETQDSLSLHSRMETGRIFVDGRHVTFSFPTGSTLEISPGPALITFCEPTANDAYIAS